MIGKLSELSFSVKLKMKDQQICNGRVFMNFIEYNTKRKPLKLSRITFALVFISMLHFGNTHKIESFECKFIHIIHI